MTARTRLGASARGTPRVPPLPVIPPPPVDGTGIIGWGASSVAVGVAARRLWPWYQDSLAPSAASAFRRIRAPRSGTIRNFRIRYSVAGTSVGATVTYTLFVNGVATALTLTIPADGASLDGSNLVAMIAVVAGDLLDIAVTKSGILLTSPQGIVGSLEYA